MIAGGRLDIVGAARSFQYSPTNEREGKTMDMDVVGTITLCHREDSDGVSLKISVLDHAGNHLKDIKVSFAGPAHALKKLEPIVSELKGLSS